MDLFVAYFLLLSEAMQHLLSEDEWCNNPEYSRYTTHPECVVVGVIRGHHCLLFLQYSELLMATLLKRYIGSNEQACV